MADLSSWSELGRWIWMLVRKGLPERALRLAWKDERILLAISTVHFEQWPRFYVRLDREPPELDAIGLNLFNLTPFEFSIVGVELRISIDGREWLTNSQRLSSEIRMPALGRSGYYFKRHLSESQARKLREHRDDWVQIRIDGYLVLKSIFGELRKEVHSDVVATIDRGERMRSQ